MKGFDWGAEFAGVPPCPKCGVRIAVQRKHDMQPLWWCQKCGSDWPRGETAPITVPWPVRR